MEVSTSTQYKGNLWLYMVNKANMVKQVNFINKINFFRIVIIFQSIIYSIGILNLDQNLYLMIPKNRVKMENY